MSAYEDSIQHFYNDVLGTHPIYKLSIDAIAISALQNNFPCTEELIGKAKFSTLAKVFSEAFPEEKAHWDINLYGERFSDFIAQQENSSVQPDNLSWKELAELACFEHHAINLYYSNKTIDLIKLKKKQTTIKVLRKNMPFNLIKKHYAWLKIDALL